VFCQRSQCGCGVLHRNRFLYHNLGLGNLNGNGLIWPNTAHWIPVVVFFAVSVHGIVRP
jgi:hypothetical protein